MDIFKKSDFQDLWQTKYKPSKSELTKLSIVRAAIRLYPGNFHLTVQAVADEAGVTRPLVKNYFESVEILFETAVRLVRMELQDFVVDQLKESKSPRDAFEVYLRSSLQWYEAQPENARFWLFFLARTTVDVEFRRKNTEWVNLGLTRIESMLKAAGQKKEVPQRARAIQLLLTSCLLSQSSENIPDLEKFRNDTAKICLGLAFD